ncbi:MAG: RidA family protein [Caldiserica bacterium]|jgi:2-iminobutanoate/2-iminopropanoate deaminase|nr:RidA family protein [Caldisericota bacterium]MDH7562363.1 RidA family protein [Caldisericota bacterium]
MNSKGKRKEILRSLPLNPHLPFSKTVQFGDLIFVSGIVGRDPQTGEIAGLDIKEQTRQALRNISSFLDEAGSSLKDALKVNVYLKDMRLFSLMNQAYREFFKDGFPARTCVEVSSIPDPDALIEIDCIAGVISPGEDPDA